MIRLLLAASGLQDVYPVTHPSSPSDISRDKTCDCPQNTWSASKRLPSIIRQQGGKRLDYILTRPPIEALRSSITLTTPIPGKMISISDHFGFEASLSLPSESSTSAPTLRREQYPLLSSEILTPALALLAAARYRSRRSAAVQFLLFVASLLAIVGLAIGGSFQGLKFLNWIFILAAAFAGARKLSKAEIFPSSKRMSLRVVVFFLGLVAATMLYASFIGGRWEQNAVAEVMEEMEEALRAVEKRDREIR
jgi:sphingomyelin phosphodiesterase 2